MLKEFVEKIVSLAEPTFKEIEGVTYASKSLVTVKPPEIEQELEFSKLSALVDYIADKVDGDLGKLFLHVESTTRVSLCGPLDMKFGSRKVFASASCKEMVAQFQFGRYMNHEEFVVGVMTGFELNPETTKLLSTVSNISAEKVRSSEDDGFSQTVQKKEGVHLKKEVEIKNPIHLRPYRTFFEAQQPESPFILRLRSSRDGYPPELALFEAQSGRWQIDAINNIGVALLEMLQHSKVEGVPVLS